MAEAARPRLACSECDRGYDSSRGLARHLLSVHGLQYRGLGRRPLVVPPEELNGLMESLRRSQRSRHPGRRNRGRGVTGGPMGPAIPERVDEAGHQGPAAVVIGYGNPDLSDGVDNGFQIPAPPGSPRRARAAADVFGSDLDDYLDAAGELPELDEVVLVGLPLGLTMEMLAVVVRACPGLSPVTVVGKLKALAFPHMTEKESAYVTDLVMAMALGEITVAVEQVRCVEAEMKRDPTGNRAYAALGAIVGGALNRPAD